MPLNPVYYIPIFTTIISLIFAALVFRRYHEKAKGAHLLWWAAGIVLYGVGTFTESYVTLFGWRQEIFRAWYISGALLPGVGGTIARLGHTEVLYVMELVGLVLIFVGYQCCIRTKAMNSIPSQLAKAGAQAST
jgi:ABC-type sugar transport system permease subunit